MTRYSRTDHSRDDDVRRRHGERMIAVRTLDIKAGEHFVTTNGALYVEQADGSIRRTDKVRMSKKERVMRRRAVKAVRLTRTECA